MKNLYHDWYFLFKIGKHEAVWSYWGWWLFQFGIMKIPERKSGCAYRALKTKGFYVSFYFWIPFDKTAL
jgi:hypothetical protein